MLANKVEMTVGDVSGGVLSIEGIMSDPPAVKALLVDSMLVAVSLGDTVTFKPVHEDGKDK